MTAAPSASLQRKRLDGPPHNEFVLAVTKARSAMSYIEIGVRDCLTFGPIGCASIGIDPAFRIKFQPMRQKPSMHLYQMTSDEYFRDHDPRVIFGRPVDVAFLDGLHLFDFLLRDFINTERICDRNSVILLDDCLPVNAEMTERQHRLNLRKDKEVAGWWTGDVWKVLNVLREYRPDLTVTPVDVSPTGSIVVTGVDPHSRVLANAYEEIIARFDTKTEMTPEEFEAHWAAYPPQSADSVLEALRR